MGIIKHVSTSILHRVKMKPYQCCTVSRCSSEQCCALSRCRCSSAALCQDADAAVLYCVKMQMQQCCTVSRCSHVSAALCQDADISVLHCIKMYQVYLFFIYSISMRIIKYCVSILIMLLISIHLINELLPSCIRVRTNLVSHVH